MSNNHYYYHRITMALDDLLRCHSYCEMMLKLPTGKSFSDERVVYEALYVALIVSYGRVFTRSDTVDKQHSNSIKNQYKTLIGSVIDSLDDICKAMHHNIIELRHTAIAHSDARSRNLKNYADSPLTVGRNPYVPYDDESVQGILNLISIFISRIGDEQNKVASVTFSKNLFGSTSIGT